MKLGMISLGCAKNLIDSELFLGVAQKYNLEITNNIKEANIIVVNTCGFIESAKKEAIDTLLDVTENKKGKIIIFPTTSPYGYSSFPKEENGEYYRLSNYC